MLSCCAVDPKVVRGGEVKRSLVGRNSNCVT